MTRLRTSHYAIAKDRLSDEQETREIRNDIYASQFSYRMTFGKHRGKTIASVPTDYLEFIRSKSNNMNTVKRCADELERRYRIVH
jgi:hypothetical protein